MKKFFAMTLAVIMLAMCFASCAPAEVDNRIKVTINVRDLPTEDDPDGVYFLKTPSDVDFKVDPETKLLDALTALCAEREGASYEVSAITGEFIKFVYGSETLEGETKKLAEDKEANKTQYVITQFVVTVNGTALKNEDIAGYVLQDNDVVEIRLTEGEPFWENN
ncbi:MAG: hypothetical protein ACI3XI_08090 [Eubacteriales bacterium]